MTESWNHEEGVKLTDETLTLDNCISGNGFASLAGIVLALLRENGKALLYVGDDGSILHKDTSEVALAHNPSLVIEPSAIVSQDEKRQTITVLLEGVQILNYSALELDIEKAG